MLPTELWEEIFLLCELKIIINTCSTCKAFQHLVDNHFWKRKVIFDDLYVFREEEVDDWKFEYKRLSDITREASRLIAIVVLSVKHDRKSTGFSIRYENEEAVNHCPESIFQSWNIERKDYKE